MSHLNYKGPKQQQQQQQQEDSQFISLLLKFRPYCVVFACNCFSNAQLFLRYLKYFIVLEQTSKHFLLTQRIWHWKLLCFYFTLLLNAVLLSLSLQST